jgi:hypothetical protein
VKVGLWEGLVVDGDGGGHELVATGGATVEASQQDLGDESVAAELGDESRCAGASSLDLLS